MRSPHLPQNPPLLLLTPPLCGQPEDLPKHVIILLPLYWTGLTRVTGRV